MTWSEKFGLELRQLIKVRKSRRSWQIPTLTASSVGVPLLISIYFNNISAGLIACLGGIVILYLPEKGSLTNKIVTILISAFGFMVSFAIGQFFSFSQLSSVLAFGIFSMIVHWVVLHYKTAPPRSFFFIFIAAISICQPFDLPEIPRKIGLLSLGLMYSSFATLAYLVYASSKLNWETQPQPQRILQRNKLANSWEAIIMGAFMAGSLLIGYLLKFDNPYWIPVSSAAVMQGASQYHIWQRTAQRIVGTLIGLALSWGLMELSHSIIVISIFIIGLQLIVEMLIVRNYALAVIFITPLAIFLSEAANPIFDTPNLLIFLRLQEIVIGSALGALGGWILHKEKIRYATIKGLQKINERIDGTN